METVDSEDQIESVSVSECFGSTDKITKNFPTHEGGSCKFYYQSRTQFESTIACFLLKIKTIAIYCVMP